MGKVCQFVAHQNGIAKFHMIYKFLFVFHVKTFDKKRKIQ